MWENGLKMDEPDVFVAAMEAANLNGKAVLEATRDPAVKQRLVHNIAATVERGAFGIPTFHLGEEMFFSKERLDQVEEEVHNQA